MPLRTIRDARNRIKPSLFRSQQKIKLLINEHRTCVRREQQLFSEVEEKKVDGVKRILNFSFKRIKYSVLQITQLINVD